MSTDMKIWVDGDAFPTALREMIYKAAKRLEVKTTVVANRNIPVPPSEWLESVRVTHEEDAADHWIVARCGPGDLVVTNDIPLAANAVDTGATVLDFRGNLMTEANVRERLSIRDFMHEMRSYGVETGGPKAFGPKDKNAFASAFDRTLSRLVRGIAP